jgi:hypothetical protein
MSVSSEMTTENKTKDNALPKKTNTTERITKRVSSKMVTTIKQKQKRPYEILKHRKTGVPIATPSNNNEEAVGSKETSHSSSNPESGAQLQC